MTCKYITLSDLINRGWNASIIKKMRLNHEVINNIKMYSLTTVQGMERTNYCKLLLNKNHKNTKIQELDDIERHKMIQYVRFVKLYINYIPEDQVTELAINAYNTLHNANVTINSNKDFLERIHKNYIRHCLTNYDNILESLNGEFGKDEVYPVLKQQLIKRIDNAWYAKQVSGCGTKLNIGDPNCVVYDFTMKLQ